MTSPESHEYADIERALSLVADVRKGSCHFLVRASETQWEAQVTLNMPDAYWPRSLRGFALTPREAALDVAKQTLRRVSHRLAVWRLHEKLTHFSTVGQLSHHHTDVRDACRDFAASIQKEYESVSDTKWKLGWDVQTRSKAWGVVTEWAGPALNATTHSLGSTPREAAIAMALKLAAACAQEENLWRTQEEILTLALAVPPSIGPSPPAWDHIMDPKV